MIKFDEICWYSIGFIECFESGQKHLLGRPQGLLFLDFLMLTKRFENQWNVQILTMKNSTCGIHTKFSMNEETKYSFMWVCKQWSLPAQIGVQGSTNIYLTESNNNDFDRVSFVNVAKLLNDIYPIN